MMRKYLYAYAMWLTFVTAAAAVALAWYRHVEEIGLQEAAARMKSQTDTDDTGDSDG